MEIFILITILFFHTSQKTNNMLPTYTSTLVTLLSTERKLSYTVFNELNDKLKTKNYF